jgi:hypothetical protein
MDTHQTHTQPQLSSVLSWLATGVVAFLCSVLGLASASFVQPFAAMFQGLGVELPLPTRIMLATHMWLLPLLFTVLAVFVVVKEFTARELRRRFLLTARVFLAVLITVGVVIFILYLPLLTLAAKSIKAK